MKNKSAEKKFELKQHVETAVIWDRLREFSLREQEMRTTLVYFRKRSKAKASCLEDGKEPEERRGGRKVVKF